MWGILVFVSWLVKKMPLITGGGNPQTRGVINGRVEYKHPLIELVSKFVGGILALKMCIRDSPNIMDFMIFQTNFNIYYGITYDIKWHRCIFIVDYMVGVLIFSDSYKSAPY